MLVTPTRLNKLFQCPRNVYFSVVLGKNEHRSEVAALGSAVHRLIEIGIVKGNADEVESNVFRVADEFGLSPSSRVELLEMVPNAAEFVRKVNSLKRVKEKYVEEEFSIPTLELKAHPDLVVEFDGGHVLIVDHKTTKKTFEHGLELPSEYRRQLDLYAYSVALNLKECKTFTLAVHHVRSGKVIRYREFTPTDIILSRGEELLSRIQSILRRQEGIWEPRPSWLCHYCPFVSSCEEGQRYIAQ